MGIFKQHRSLVLLGVAVVTLGVGVLLIMRSVTPSGANSMLGSDKVYFYDLTTKTLFATAVTEVPPIAAPSGHALANGKPAGVRAYVFSCSDCNDASTLHVQYLEQFTDEARAARLASNLPRLDRTKAPRSFAAQHGPANPNEGRLIASPEKLDNWISASEDEAKAVINAQISCPAGGQAHPCDPR